MEVKDLDNMKPVLAPWRMDFSLDQYDQNLPGPPYQGFISTLSKATLSDIYISIPSMLYSRVEAQEGSTYLLPELLLLD